MRKTIYKVYEVSAQYRKHGKLLKRYVSKQRAYQFMQKSIFRYIKEDTLIYDQKLTESK